MNEEMIETKLDELNSMDGIDKTPEIPVSVAVAEAMTLLDRVNKDREVLLHAGLKAQYIDELKARALALQLAQSKWATEYKKFSDCQEEWRRIAPEAYDFRKELLHHFYFAFHKQPENYARVQRIAEGTSHDDMVQDLSDIADLAEANKEALTAINFDLSLIHKAKTLGKELVELLGKVNGARNEKSEAIELRNKAYYHLKEAVDEIRRTGRYVFWKDQDIFSEYSSHFKRKKNKKYSKSGKSIVETAQE